MAIREVREIGDEILGKQCKEVKKMTIRTKILIGDMLCIIEAMKTMNEITADCDGQILQIYAGNGQLVEVGQRLFLVGEAQ